MTVRIRDNLIELSKKRLNNRRSWNVFLYSLTVFVLILFVLKVFIFTSVVVSGESMKPTLLSGDKLLVNRIQKPKHGDIVVFADGYVDENGKLVYNKTADGSVRYLIKRYIASDGQTVYWKNGDVFISYKNDYGYFFVKINEPYLLKQSSTYTKLWLNEGDNMEGTVVPEGCFFALGDNREVSLDSRKKGSFDERLILGVVCDFSVDNKDSFLNKLLCRLF